MFDEKIAELDVDFFAKQMASEFAQTLSLSNEEFAKQQEINKKYRDFLCSLIKC